MEPQGDGGSTQSERHPKKVGRHFPLLPRERCEGQPINERYNAEFDQNVFSNQQFDDGQSTSYDGHSTGNEQSHSPLGREARITQRLGEPGSGTATGSGAHGRASSRGTAPVEEPSEVGSVSWIEKAKKLAAKGSERMKELHARFRGEDGFAP